MPRLSPPTCADCGRFFRVEPGVAWKMVYSGYPPSPDREIFKCKRCCEKNGPFTPQHNIRPEYSCGILRGDHA